MISNNYPSYMDCFHELSQNTKFLQSFVDEPYPHSAFSIPVVLAARMTICREIKDMPNSFIT